MQERNADGRRKEVSGFFFFGETSSLSGGTSWGWRKAVSASSTLGLPPALTPFPGEGSLAGGSSGVSHRAPPKPPLTWFKGVSVCPQKLALFISRCPHPLPKFGVLPEGPSLPPLSSASSSSLDPLALEVREGQPGLQICP